MSFESGSMSFRIFQPLREMPEDAASRFAQHAAPPLEDVGQEERRGWVTGRHLLDRNITEESACRGQHLFMTLQQAERKVPASLLKAECKMEEMAIMAADGRPFINKQEKAEIRRAVIERLIPHTSPQISGTQCVCPPSYPYLFADCLPVKQCDLFSCMFQQTMGFAALPMTPELAALELLGVDTGKWNAVSFSPEVPADMMECLPGRDFLTWLWFYSEACGGVFPVYDAYHVAIMLEGPLLFAHEGSGAYETIVRKGEPIMSSESKACLMSGKKLKQACVSFVIGEEVWRFSLDADEFVFRNVKIPPIEEFLDPVSDFCERMGRLERFVDMFIKIYSHFVDVRTDKAKWQAMQKDIFNWVEHRLTRV